MSLLEKPCPRCKGARKVRNMLLPGRHVCRRCDGLGEIPTALGRVVSEMKSRARRALEPDIEEF